MGAINIENCNVTEFRCIIRTLLYMNQFLYRPDVPEGIDGSLRVPKLNDLWLVQAEQCLHALLCHIWHHLLVH